jgi:hypothetical protein
LSPALRPVLAAARRLLDRTRAVASASAVEESPPRALRVGPGARARASWRLTAPPPHAWDSAGDESMGELATERQASSG